MNTIYQNLTTKVLMSYTLYSHPNPFINFKNAEILAPSFFCTHWLLHNSPANRARELFKPSKAAVSLVISIFLKREILDLTLFVGDVLAGFALSHPHHTLPFIGTEGSIL